MKVLLKNKHLKLTPNQIKVYTVRKGIDSYDLYYSYSTQQKLTGGFFIAELIGDGVSKGIYIKLNEFEEKIIYSFMEDSITRIANFRVNKINFYSELKVDFYITLYAS